MSEKTLLGILFGGNSAEHEISIITALQAMEAIDSERFEIIPLYVNHNQRWYTGPSLFERTFFRSLPASLGSLNEVYLRPDPTIQGVIDKVSGRVIPIDVYLTLFHGQFGEDGAIQGALEMAGAAYTGCDRSASSIAMNKHLCKAYVAQFGLPVLPSNLVRRPKPKAPFDLSGVTLPYPLFVKPNNLGSSIAVNAVENEEQLKTALAHVFRFDDAAIVEPAITNLMEVNIALLDDGQLRTSVLEIPVASGCALSYADKYLRKESKFGEAGSDGMASLSRVIDPPDLAPALKESITTFAKQAYRALDCAGCVRIDFMIDTKTDTLYFNELNPVPGSLAYYLWEKSSPPMLYTDLINKMINQAFARRAQRLLLDHDFGFKAL